MKDKTKLFVQIIKFGFVGGSAFVIDAGLLFILTEFFGVHYLISGTVSFSVSVIYNYILSVNWVFNPNKKMKKTIEMVIFIGLSIIGLGINQIIMWIFVDLFHVYYMLSKVVATVVVMIYNFVTRKLFIEGKK